ncbi:MAG: hypothetical protein EZS28_036072, partial [Streblomastix strix]
MKVFHSAGLIHRDIKCDNILLHSPPGSGRVYAKISDFGFAKKEEMTSEQTYLAGTIPFMVYNKWPNCCYYTMMFINLLAQPKANEIKCAKSS